MAYYFFPCLFLIPDSDMPDVQVDLFGLVIRKWEVSIFDLATLGVNHKLHLAYELMNVFLSQCNLEIMVSADSPEEAQSKVLSLRTSLYIQGIAPFLIPFVCTHSINEIAGTNSRDSEHLREKLPDGLKNGLTSKTGTVEAWPFELSFQVIPIGEKRLTKSVFTSACRMAGEWQGLVKHHPLLKAVQDSLIAAPMLVDVGQSVLNIWTALEALFPKVTSEVTFQVALYLAQLNVGKTDKLAYLARVKQAYKTRSKIVHGGGHEVNLIDWDNAWSLLRNACKSILDRGRLPSEDDLLQELLATSENR